MKENIISHLINVLLYPTVLLISGKEKKIKYGKWIEKKFPNTLY